MQNEFGTIVNNEEAPAKIEEAPLNLSIPHSLFDSLLAHARKKGFPNVEAFAAFVLSQAVHQKVGATHIEGPSVMSGHSTGKITGFKGGIVKRV